MTLAMFLGVRVGYAKYVGSGSTDSSFEESSMDKGQVRLYLDKVYAGGVNRIDVGIWADTGEVRRILTKSG